MMRFNKGEIKMFDRLLNTKYYKNLGNDDYFRWQKDMQYTQRNNEQKQIFENYFVVKRDNKFKKESKVFWYTSYCSFFRKSFI